MRSKPITHNDRDQVVHSLVKDMFKADKAAIADREGKLAVELYDMLYTKSERATLSKLAGTGWFVENSAIRARVGGAIVDLCFQDPETLAFKYYHKSSYQIKLDLEISEPLGAKIREWKDDKDDHDQEVKSFKAKIRAQLNSVRTTKQLLDAWPEVLPWLPARLTTEHAPVPMVQVTEINKLICDKLGPKGGTCDGE